MPDRSTLERPRSWARLNPQHPYERIAAHLARLVESGELHAGDPAPTAATIAGEHDVSLATARRAVALAKEWGVLVSDASGRPRVATPSAALPADADLASPVEPASTSTYWVVVVVAADGTRYRPRTVRGDLAAPDSFRHHLAGIVRVERSEVFSMPANEYIGSCELHASRPQSDQVEAVLRLGESELDG